jgi:hypothetical protein
MIVVYIAFLERTPQCCLMHCSEGEESLVIYAGIEFD